MATFQVYRKEEIDKVKWDACIAASHSKRAYGFFDFLNIMCDDWIGLVWGNYNTCLAIPYKETMIGKWLVTPAFLQQINIFGDETLVDFKQLEYWLNKTFKVILLNSTNLVLGKAKTKSRTNYIINLRQEHQFLASNYKHHAHRNLKKSAKCCLILQENINIDIVISKFKMAYGKLSGLQEKHYESIKKLFHYTSAQFQLKTFGVYKDSELIYTAALLFDNSCIYYILGAPTEAGRKCSVTYFFIDRILKMHAEKMDIFDFEGSDLQNVASFYKNFGPKAEKYFFSFKNNYPFPLNLLINKKLQIK